MLCNFCHSLLTSTSTFLTTVPIQFICDNGASRFLWNTGTFIPANIAAHLTVQRPSTQMLCFWTTIQFQIQQNIICGASRNAMPCSPVKLVPVCWRNLSPNYTATRPIFTSMSVSSKYHHHAIFIAPYHTVKDTTNIFKDYLVEHGKGSSKLPTYLLPSDNAKTT